MKRFKKTVAVTGKTRLSGSGLIAMALATTLVAALPNLAAAQSDQGLLDEYLTEIERLISGNDLEGARASSLKQHWPTWKTKALR